ncbi:TolC family protein [Vibrio sp. TH_r3]|uniref:TolC family protein n=1 Tax=Vibrio sp. TH_r3 TaxID=3082084 RepID=UPI002955881C|nr:TolC family protein [Vibrio sp. TH_r3]MDV7102795.1 TolC family protein [Vibrio sp. TH_r3]
MNYKSKITFLFASVVFSTSSLVSSTSVAGEISFEDAWGLLQTENSAIAAQRANVDRYQQLEKAKSALNLPSITLGANYTRLDDDVTVTGEQLADSLNSTGTALLASTGLSSLLAGITSTVTEKDLFNSSIRAIWPIFTGGRIDAAQAIASGQTDQAVAQLAMETQAQYDDLAKYYFGVVLAKDVLQTKISVEKGLTKHRDFAIKLEQQGQIARVERLQAEASLDKAIVDRKKSQKDVEIAISALTKILNQDQAVLPKTTLFINDKLPPLNAFITQTLTTYPGLSILEAKDKQASQLISAERGRYYPQVYLYGNYTLYEDDSLASQLAPDWLVGVGVNVPLLDNNGRSESIQAAQSAKLQVNHLRQQAKRDLTVLVEKTYFEAEQAIDEVKGLNSSLTLAKENLRLRTKAFNQGLATSLEVVDAELYVASVRTQQQVASFNYLISLNKLLALSSEMKTFNQYSSNPSQTVKSEVKQ